MLPLWFVACVAEVRIKKYIFLITMVIISFAISAFSHNR